MKTDSQNPKLTDIKGIGNVRRKWLQEVGIHEIPELLTVPIEEIEKQFIFNGHKISSTEIENWQEQAQLMIDVDEIGLPDPLESSEGHTIATFIVEYQRYPTKKGNVIHTLVQHMEGGELGEGTNKRWAGFADNKLTDWIKGQIVEEAFSLEEVEATMNAIPQDQTVVAKEAFTESPYTPINVTISRLQVCQPTETPTVVVQAQSGEIFTDFIKGEQPFTMTAQLEFSPLKDAKPETSLINYEVQTYITNRKTGDLIRLNQIDHIDIDCGLTKSTRLPNITLPIGYYRLQTIVTVKSDANAISFLEVPLLKVI